MSRYHSPSSRGNPSIGALVRAFFNWPKASCLVPLTSQTSRPPSVCGIHLQLPVSASQIEATEKPRATERVQAVLNVRERVSVYLRDLVESSVVDTEPRRSILFPAPCTVALLDDANGQHVLNQLPFLLPTRCWVASDSLARPPRDPISSMSVPPRWTPLIPYRPGADPVPPDPCREVYSIFYSDRLLCRRTLLGFRVYCDGGDCPFPERPSVGLVGHSLA